MTHRIYTPNVRPTNGLGGMLALSLVCHVVLFFWAGRLELYPGDLPVAQPIYVELLNLPVEAPQAGSPSGSTRGVPSPVKAPTTAPLPPPPRREMKLPATRKASNKPVPLPQKAARQESAREYEARLEALEQRDDARRQEVALADIRKRIASRSRENAPAGMPGGSGSQAGSDYAAFIQSRLKDSFQQTIAWQSKKPLMVVRLQIDARGGLISYKVEKSSGDVVFEEAVYRAVQLAKKNFVPPPGGKEFGYGFVFKPEGVDKK